MHPKLNDTSIFSLIKKDNPTYVHCYRPTSLCNVTYNLGQHAKTSFKEFNFSLPNSVCTRKNHIRQHFVNTGDCTYNEKEKKKKKRKKGFKGNESEYGKGIR